MVDPGQRAAFKLASPARSVIVFSPDACETHSQLESGNPL